MKLLQGNGGRNNYQWMRLRIERLWPRWTAGAKQLLANGSLQNIKKKQVYDFK